MSNQNAYWTDERVTLLKRYWNDGVSAGQIAARLGDISRNAILGKIARLRAEDGTGVKRKPKVKLERTVKPRPEKIAKLPIFKSPAADLPVHLPEPKSLDMTLIELGSRDCRWPVSGDKATTLFCGHKVVQGSRYCACHHARSINPRARTQPTIDEIVRKVA